MWWLSTIAMAAPWVVSGELGGEFNRDPHGIVNVSATSGDWTAALITDTVDLRYAPSWDGGRAWAAARVATFAAGMVIGPWEDGQLRPERAMNSAYGGLEAGAVRYAAHGLYSGAQGHVRWHDFYGGPNPTLPPGRWHVQAQGITGWWRPFLHAWGVVGIDLQRSADATVRSASPHARGQFTVRPEWTLAPLLEGRAGTGWNQDIVTWTRLGGLNPYVVPLAGAAWAEFWVQSYGAARLGGVVQTEALDVAAFVDVAAFQGPQGNGDAVGLGVAPRWRIGRVTVDLAVGGAPRIVGLPGRVPVSVYTLVAWRGGGGRPGP